MDKLATTSSCFLLALSFCSVLVFVRVQAVSVATNRLRISPSPGEALELDTDDEWEMEDAETLRIRLIRSLGLSKMPDLSQVSISSEAMDRAYEIYWKNVAETERRNQQLLTASSRSTSQHKDEENKENKNGNVVTVTYNDQGATHVPPEAFSSLWFNRNLSASWLYFAVQNLTSGTDYVTSDRVPTSIKATLHLRVTGPVHLSVYKVTWDGRVELVGKARSAPFEWDVSDTVRTWSHSSRPLNRGFIVMCTQHCDSIDKSSMPKGSDATLRVYVTTTGSGGIGLRRNKRSTPHDLLKEPTFTEKTDCTKGMRHSYCCRKNLTVTAAQLGLSDIIIEPKKFNFYYCRGKCPHKYNPASTHAILQSLIYRTYKKGGKVCCAPSKLGDLEVLHLDESSKKPVHSQWKNAVVLECACS